jgi:hypothetical protein
MHLERRTVSRKTPNDGRLEISKQAAATVDALGGAFELDLDGSRSSAAVGTMDCTCRGVDNPHVHYFIESPALKALPVGGEVDVDVDLETHIVSVCKVEG